MRQVVVPLFKAAGLIFSFNAWRRLRFSVAFAYSNGVFTALPNILRLKGAGVLARPAGSHHAPFTRGADGSLGSELLGGNLGGTERREADPCTATDTVSVDQKYVHRQTG